MEMFCTWGRQSRKKAIFELITARLTHRTSGTPRFDARSSSKSHPFYGFVESCLFWALL